MTKAVKATGPRMAVCTCQGVINVSGSRGGAYQFTAGAQVDLNKVVGDCGGEPVTLAEALGPHLSFFRGQPAPSKFSAPADQE